jgi:hypothetical protein
MQEGTVIREQRKLGRTFGLTDGGNRDPSVTESTAESSWVLPNNCVTWYRPDR